MPTRRRELRSSLQEHVRAGLRASAPSLAVTAARAFSLGDNQLPQLSITADSESLAILSVWPRVYRRSLSLRLTHLVGLRLGSQLEDELDANLVRMEAVVHAWKPSGVHHVLVTEADSDLYLDGRIQCGASLLSVTVVYDTEEPTDEVADDLLGVQVEVKK